MGEEPHLKLDLPTPMSAMVLLPGPRLAGAFCALSRPHLNAMSREVQGKVVSDFTDADIIP